MFVLFHNYYTRLIRFSKNVKLYLLALTLNSIGTGMFLVLYNLYLKELQYNEAFVGRTVSLKALAAVLILLPAGVFSDRLGRRKAMITGAVFSGISFAILSLLEDANIILIFIFCNGVFNSFFMVAQAPFIMENTTPKERIHLFSINSALMVGAWMLGNIIGGWIPDILTYWFTTLVAMKITLMISALIIFLGAVPLIKIREIQTHQQRNFDEIIKMLRDKKELLTLGKFILPSALVGFGAGLFVPYTNLYLANQYGMTTSLIGIVMALSQIMTAFATLFAPVLVKQVGRVKGIFIFQMSSIPFLFIMATTSNVFLAMVAVLLRTALMNAANPITSNLMMEEVGDKVKGIANSLSQMAFQLGWVVMGPISGMIIAEYGYSYVFFLAMFFYLGSALCYFIFFRHLDEEKVQSAIY
ncbi:hypothetical protein BBF96_00780 [Anoxybacter fermentans]|uniref:Major facilitator superfamily (MFS) profile domain-containing protein n=1 Tax=Anoxybacter fermentans TaxID=1323375 RepID=A0A3S9T2L8_9FIRM|nr:MFS transporter [Anoxybacter fermentans]AZR74767.1 hypothetical protein BBF96_00780 [Anoxybacter fermentans]